MSRWSKLIIVTVLMILVQGCHRTEPWRELPTRQLAAWVVVASQQAALYVGWEKAAAAYAYGDCMTHRAESQSCDVLYKRMLQYLHHYKPLHRLTVQQLRSPKFYRHIQSEYNKLCYQGL